MTRCENEWRRRGTRSRGQVSQCERNATVTVHRERWSRESGMERQEMEVCGTCANRVTTGSDRDQTWQWRRSDRVWND